MHLRAQGQIPRHRVPAKPAARDSRALVALRPFRRRRPEGGRQEGWRWKGGAVGGRYAVRADVWKKKRGITNVPSLTSSSVLVVNIGYLGLTNEVDVASAVEFHCMICCDQAILSELPQRRLRNRPRGIDSALSTTQLASDPITDKGTSSSLKMSTTSTVPTLQKNMIYEIVPLPHEQP